MGHYNFEDIALSEDGDLIVDNDPLDDGSNVGWDFLTTSKYARDQRRVEMGAPGSHPDQEDGTLLMFYLTALRQVYPGVSDEVLLDSVKNWSYKKEDYYEALRQVIRERVKTTNEDWRLYPSVGADLETQIGEDITFDTLENIRALIWRALTYDKMIEQERLQIRTFRGGASLVLIVVDVIINDQVTVREVIPFSFVQGPYLMMKEAS